MNWEEILSSCSSRGKSPNSAAINGVGLVWPGIRRILACLQVNALGLFFQPGKAADTVLEAINISIMSGFQLCSSCRGAEATRLAGNAPAPTWEAGNEIPAFLSLPVENRPDLCPAQSVGFWGRKCISKLVTTFESAYINQGWAVLLKNYFFNLSVCQWRIFIRKLSTSADPGFPTSSEVRLNICQPSQLFYHFPAELFAAGKRKGVLSPHLTPRAQLPCQCKSGSAFQGSGVRNKTLIRMDHALPSVNSQGETGSH